jgi:hypothetical protein
MFRQSSKWLVVVFASGVLVAGCGSSSSVSSSSTTSSSTSSTPAATKTSTSPTNSPSGPGVAQAVAACKSGVQKAPTLSASVKAKIEGICDKVGTDPAAARKAAKEVCVEIVNASPIPAGAIKERALAGCKSS